MQSNLMKFAPLVSDFTAHIDKGFPGGSVGKESACNARDTGD